jgi:nucleotide-binding universal stress UspA family protein
MTEPILVGVALRDDDGPVLALAHELADAAGAPLVLGHAYPFQPLIAIPPPEWVEELRLQSAARLAALADGARTLCRANPSPVRMLHEAAEELGAGMIVVGSSHRGPAGRVVPGGVGERLLHGAPCPVAIAPRGYARPPGGLRRVGIADAAVPDGAAVRALARTFNGAQVTTYTVIGPGRREPRVAAGAVVLRGDPAAELARISGELDLLLTGSRGYGRLRSRLAGGVTGELAHTARCPLVVVGADR